MMQIDLYSGLLGVGKTTLIRRMLDTAYKDQQVVILENEIGKVNYDSAVLESSKIEVQRLTAGCVCCTIAAGLQNAVRMIEEQLHPDVVIIEPSGAADVKNLLKVIEEIPDVQIGRSIMVINAKKCHALLKVVGEFFSDQIRCADMIFLNFVEKLKEGQLDSVEEELLEINPRVKFAAVPMSEVAADTFPVRAEVNFAADLSRETAEEQPGGEHSFGEQPAGEAASPGENPAGNEAASPTGKSTENGTLGKVRVYGAERDHSLQVKELPEEQSSGKAGIAGSAENTSRRMTGMADAVGSTSRRMIRMGSHRGSRTDGSDTIYTWEYNFDHPFTEQMVQKLTAIFQSDESSKIWRVKGVLTMEDGTFRKYDISFGDEFEEAWTSDAEVPKNTLVIIGTSIPRNWLEHHFSEL